MKEHNPNWPNFSDHPHRILKNEGSRSGKINSLFNLISGALGIDKIYWYAKDSYEAKYQLLINKHENTGLKVLFESSLCISFYWMLEWFG